MKKIILPLLLMSCVLCRAQSPDEVLVPNIVSVQLHVYGDQLGYPMIHLNSTEQLELHFDDLDGNVKNYSYTFQLCNADWTPALLSYFDYIKGYSQMRITTYRIASIAFTKYTHYQAVLPDRNCYPTRSGNYLLKVFRDGDPNKVVLTRRFYVLDERTRVEASIQQPFNGQYFRTHQKVQFKLGFNEQLNIVNHLQQVKVVLLQNNRWDNALTTIRPTFFSRNQMEFNTEADCVFPSGKEWRWLDLRSFRLQSDRVANALYSTTATEIFVKPDMDRSAQRFNFFRDANGQYTIQCLENLNPYWQGDYATVHFAFVPPDNLELPGKDVYVFGQLTNYAFNDQTKMTFVPENGAYEAKLFLKQGYYDYTYVTLDRGDRRARAVFDYTEGNYWETENNYTLLVYYRPLAGRADELVGYKIVNSLTGRQGIGTPR